MRIVVIGATGHVGTYLVPQLVENGYEVVAVSRNLRQPYQSNSSWDGVESVSLTRTEGENDDTFSATIASLRPDIVIDMICFTLGGAQSLLNTLRGSVQQLLVCGSIWIHGPSSAVPVTESEGRNPFGDYGIQKLAMTEYFESEYEENNTPVTTVHPGHIVGPGWIPLNPQGNFDANIYDTIRKGESLILPHFGMETVHHVHASDVAGVFVAAIENRASAVGHAFHAVSERAISLRGYAEAMFRYYGHEPNITYVSWDEFAAKVSPGDANATKDHISHSPSCSMDKAFKLLNFKPSYSSIDAVLESIGSFS